MKEIWNEFIEIERLICDGYCKYGTSTEITQEELDRECDNCPFDRLESFLRLKL